MSLLGKLFLRSQALYPNELRARGATEQSAAGTLGGLPVDEPRSVVVVPILGYARGMKPIALAVALSVWISCGSAPAADVKVYAVGMVDAATPLLMFTGVYRADPRSQTVVWSVEGVRTARAALEKCAVRDALNWRCEGGESAPSGSVMATGICELGVVPEGWKFLTEAEWKALQQR